MIADSLASARAAKDERLAALDAYRILDTPSEAGFDDIVALAALLCEAPVALVSLVAGDRQWFKARIGFPFCETDLDSSVCAFALSEPDLLVVPDLTQDPRTRANPLVTGDPHIRFYAGAPLRTPEGHVLGSLCVIDHQARPSGLTPPQADALRRLGRQVMTQMELRRSVAERREQDTRHHQILQSAVDFAIVATDRDGRVTEWNTGSERILGWSPDEMRGQSIRRIFTPQDRVTSRAEEEMRSALEQGRAGDERWHIRKDGTHFFASGEMMPLRDGDGAHLGFIKILRDRTHEHRIGERLRATDADLQRAQEAGGIGLFWIRIEDDLLYATPPLCRLFGLPERGSCPASIFENCIVPEDRPLVLSGHDRRQGHAVPPVEYRIRRVDTGAIRWIARQGQIERDAEGRPVRFVGVVRDITDAVQAREQLQREQERLAQMFEQAPTFMALLSGPQHRIDRVNPGYVKLIGGRDVVGKTVAEALPDAVEQGFLDLLDGVYRSGEPFMANGYRYAVQTGPDASVDERFVDFVYQPLRDPTGHVSGIFVEGADVTARTVGSIALRQSQERLQLALDAAGIGIYDYDLVSGSLRWDARVRELFGAPVEGNITYDGTFLAGLHPDDRATADAAVQSALDPTGPGVFDIEYRVRALDSGVERWVAARGKAIVVDGRTVRFVGTVRDISTRKYAGDHLRAAEERYRMAARATSDAIWDWDLTTNQVLWNEALTTAHGHAVAAVEPTGDWWLAQIHPSDRERVAHSIHAVIDGTGEIWAESYRFRRADNSYAAIEDRGYVIRDAAGQAVRMVGAMLDVTRRTESERRRAALAELSERFRDLTDPTAIAYAACEVLGEALGVSRVGYGIIDKDAETITIERDWNAPGIESIAGTLHFRDYGTYIDQLKRGETVVLSDAVTDPRTVATADALRAISALSFVNMPLVEHGRFVALLYANNAAARHWPDDELGLMREVAERARAAIERVRSEAALRQSEEQFRVFAQAVPHHVWASRPDGYLYWFNEQVYAYCGVAAGELDGATAWGRIIHPDDLAAAGEAWARSLSTGEIYEVEFRIRRADAAYRWFLARAVPVRADGGRVVRWVGTNTDIDERRRQAAELARLNATLEEQVTERTRERNRLWETTNDLMGTAGVDGFLKSVNPAWTRMLGWSDGEILGRPFAALVDPADRPEAANVVRRLAAGAMVTGFVDRVLTKGGKSRVVMWTAVPDPGTGSFHIVGRDLTEQRHAEEALRQAQKMEAVGQLTGGLAHDFNNLLTGITGSLELLQIRVTQGRVTEIDRYVSAAQGAAKRAAALTHRLLAFSRRQTLDPKPTDANRLVNGMEDLLRRTIGPAIRLEVVTAVGLWSTLVDPPQLENALLNLCINARDAMPEGGCITIETANRWFDDRTARERDVSRGQYISVCVTDTGTGMTPEVVEKAFDPFFTTKPLGQGTGLGLSMIYGFVRQSDGQVRIYSEAGHGTTLCLYLPRHLDSEPDEDPSADLAAAPRAAHGETVLIVDDEPTVRMLVIEVLEDLGYMAAEAADGPAGLELLRSDMRIDLLITDVGLPGGMNGRQMADAARTWRPHLKVLFITGYAENAVLGNGHLGPGMQVLTKPFVLETLASRIREMIGKN